MTSKSTYIPAKPGLWSKGNGSGHRSVPGRSESAIVKAFMKKAKKAFPDAFFFKIHGGAYQKAGIPDVMVILSGIPIFIEFKKPGSDTTPLQVKTMIALENSGAYVGIAMSEDDGVGILKDALADALHKENDTCE